MGLRIDKNQKLPRRDFRRIIGRIHISLAECDPDTGVAPPFLLVKDGCRRIDLTRVIAALTLNPGHDETAIVASVREPGLCPADVAMTRAYIHRFGGDVTAPCGLPVTGKMLLLDENIPPETIVPLSRSFGWATHVQPEGLAGRDTVDELIWNFAQENGIAAIVTRDSDFLGIHRRRFPGAFDTAAAPRLIFIEGNISGPDLQAAFSRHRPSLTRLLSSPDAGCILSAQGGCRTLGYGLQ